MNGCPTVFKMKWRRPPGGPVRFPKPDGGDPRRVVDFLDRVFEPSRFHVNATLRGFYFTSGTQEGTPNDQLIGALSRQLGSQDMGAAAYSGRGRSYF